MVGYVVLSVGAEVWIDQMKKIFEGVSWIRSADGALQAVGGPTKIRGSGD